MQCFRKCLGTERLPDLAERLKLEREAALFVQREARKTKAVQKALIKVACKFPKRSE